MSDSSLKTPNSLNQSCKSLIQSYIHQCCLSGVCSLTLAYSKAS